MARSPRASTSSLERARTGERNFSSEYTQREESIFGGSSEIILDFFSDPKFDRKSAVYRRCRIRSTGFRAADASSKGLANLAIGRRALSFDSNSLDARGQAPPSVLPVGLIKIHDSRSRGS